MHKHHPKNNYSGNNYNRSCRARVHNRNLWQSRNPNPNNHSNYCHDWHGFISHQNAVEMLFRELQREYQIIEPNVEYRDNDGRIAGEIDLLGYKNGEFHLYEIKTGQNRAIAAKEQLLRAKGMLGLSNVRLFYVYAPREKNEKNHGGGCSSGRDYDSRCDGKNREAAVNENNTCEVSENKKYTIQELVF